MSLYSDVASDFQAANGDVLIVTDKTAVENSIDNILSIKKGSVPGHPEVGSVLEEFIGEFMDEITYEGMREAVFNALLEQETRITIKNAGDISVTPYLSLNIVVIDIAYTLKSNGRVYVFSKSIAV